MSNPKPFLIYYDEKNINIQNLIEFSKEDFLSQKEYIELCSHAGFGYLLTSGDYPEVENIFLLFWELFKENNDIKILLDNGFYFILHKSVDNNECQSFLIRLYNSTNRTIKTVDIWHEMTVELPNEMGSIDINDFYVNIDTHPDDEENIFKIIDGFLTVLSFKDTKLLSAEV